MPLTVAKPCLPTPSPGDTKHTADVDDAHAAVMQWLAPTVAVGVASRLPKPSPDTVTLHPAVDAWFIWSTKLTTGAAETRQQT